MKFKLKDKITNTGDWQIINNDLIYVSKDELKSYNQNNTILTLTEYWGIMFLSDFFNVFTNRSFNTFYNYEGTLIKEYDKTNFYYILSEDDLIYYDRVSKKTMHNEIEIFDGKIGKSFLHMKNIFFDKNRSIHRMDIDTGELTWQFPISQFGKFVSSWGEERDYEIEQFIGIHNNILWIKISFFSGGLIGLDVETGELRHQLKFSNDFIGLTSIKSIKDNDVPFYRCNYSLLDNGRIIALAIDIYYEIDLTSDKPKVTAYGLDEEYQKFGIDKESISHNIVLQENHLYFYNHNQHIFAILNIETKKIIYVSDKINVPDTQEAWGQLKDLKVSEDKVYVLDSTNTLNIFEQVPPASASL